MKRELASGGPFYSAGVQYEVYSCVGTDDHG